MRAAVAAIVFLSIPVAVADYQRDEDAMERGRDMPPCKESDCGANPRGGEGKLLSLVMKNN